MAEDDTCSSCSLGFDEDPGGTASRQRCWLLIEQPGAWGRNALLESKLPAEVARVLDERRQAAGVRVLLIRRGPGTEVAERRRWMFVRATATEPVMGGGGFSDPAELLDLDLHGMAVGRGAAARRRSRAARRRLHPRPPRPLLCRQRPPGGPPPPPGGGRRLGVLPRRRGPVRRQRRVLPPRPVPRPGHPGVGATAGPRLRRRSHPPRRLPGPRRLATRRPAGRDPAAPRARRVGRRGPGADEPRARRTPARVGFTVGGTEHEVVVDVGQADEPRLLACSNSGPGRPRVITEVSIRLRGLNGRLVGPGDRNRWQGWGRGVGLRRRRGRSAARIVTVRGRLRRFREELFGSGA